MRSKCATLCLGRRDDFVSAPLPTVRASGLLVNVAPAVAYTAAIFYGGLIRLGALPEMGPIPTDKLLHALTFGGLVLLIEHALRYVRPLLDFRPRVTAAVFVASTLGALLEVLQSATDYRSADVFDWVADTVGTLLAAGVIVMARWLLSKRSHA